MPDKKTILCAVSDEHVKRQILDALSLSESYLLTFVDDSGDLLLQLLEKDIHLSIIDEGLAGMSSPKLVKIIKKTRPKIPLIILSSASDDSKKKMSEILEQGIFYFLLKPVRGEEIKSAVESGLKKIQYVNSI